MDSVLHGICEEYSRFSEQSKELAKINKNLIEFNKVFGSFLLGLQLNSDCMQLEKMGVVLQQKEPPVQPVETSSPESSESVSQLPRPNSKRNTLQMTKKILRGLPYNSRVSVNNAEIESIILFLFQCPDGAYLVDIVTECGIEKKKVSGYLNILLRTKDITKISKKGFLYQLNMEKHNI